MRPHTLGPTHGRGRHQSPWGTSSGNTPLHQRPHGAAVRDRRIPVTNNYGYQALSTRSMLGGGGGYTATGADWGAIGSC